MELQVQRSERVMAPLPFVWEEMDCLDRLLAMSVHVAEYEVGFDGQRARGRTVVAWGPVKRILHLDAIVLGLVTERQIRYAIEAPSVGTRFEANIDLIPMGQHETKFDVCATLEVHNRLATRLRHTLDEMTEEYVHRITERVKSRAEKHRLAEERLLSAPLVRPRI